MKNIGQMMKQVQEMQEKMQSMQEQMQEMSIEGTSGAGIVRVVLDGKGKMRSIKLDKTIVNADETEVLEDLIIAAVNDARNRTDDHVADEMQKLTGGIPLPPGMTLPF